MLIEQGTSQGARTIIKDSEGNVISKVISFDTETKEAEIHAYYKAGSKLEIATTWKDPNHRTFFEKDGVKSPGRKFVTFKCHLAHCKAYDKHTGEEIV